MAEAVTEAVSRNADLRNRATNLLDGMFTEAETMLRSGSPPVKLALLKALVPAVVKALTAEEQVDSAAEIRSELESIRQALVLQVGQGDAEQVAVADGPVVDEAPKPKGRKR